MTTHVQLHQYEYIFMNLVPNGYYIHTCWIFYYICMGNPYSRDLLEKPTAAMLVKILCHLRYSKYNYRIQMSVPLFPILA